MSSSLIDGVRRQYHLLNVDQTRLGALASVSKLGEKRTAAADRCYSLPSHLPFSLLCDSRCGVMSLFFDKSVTFSSLPIDRRLFKAAARQRLIHPSLIQAKVLPLALQNRDILISARTGAGKTLAYLLPTLQRLITAKEASPNASPAVRAIVLVPTRELALQVRDVLNQFTYYCSDLISSLTLVADSKAATQLPLLRQRPDVLIATPGRLREHIEAGAVDVGGVLVLVLDEADLLFSFDYETDVRAIHAALPSPHQTLLLSATLTQSVSSLSKLLLTHPLSVTLDSTATDPHNGTATLSEYYIRTAAKDKFLLLYAFLKLRVVGSGKVLFFVSTIDVAFRLKLQLQQFGISSAVMNEQLPFNSRRATLQQFNRGAYDYLICTDGSVKGEDAKGLKQEEEQKEAGRQKTVDELVRVEELDVKVKEEDDVVDETEGEERVEEGGEEEQEGDEQIEEDERKEAHANKKQQKKRKLTDDEPVDLSHETDETVKEEADDTAAVSAGRRKRGKGVKREYGMSRGIDFLDVSTVINVDFPTSVASYIHRVGRTARAGKAGTAISLVTSADLPQLEALLAHQTQQAAQSMLDAKPTLQPLSFNAADIEAFRYRVEDVSRAVTHSLVQQTRTDEMRRELVNSERLKAWYEDRPDDWTHLMRADRRTKGSKIQKHLTHVPDYLVPKGMTSDELGGGETGSMGRGEEAAAGGGGRGGRGGKRRGGGGGGGGGSGRGRRDDPLKNVDRSGQRGGRASGTSGRGAARTKAPLGI